jgi:hypothetical protein
VVLPVTKRNYMTALDSVSVRRLHRLRRKLRSCCKVFYVVVLGLIVGSCGPSLTAPSPVNITGTWRTDDQIGPVTRVEMAITQRSDGTVTGRWFGTSLQEELSCPPQLGLNPTNTISGTNTVVEVELALLGVGEFEGQVLSANTLQGSFVSCGNVYPIKFSLAPPASTGQ